MITASIQTVGMLYLLYCNFYIIIISPYYNILYIKYVVVLSMPYHIMSYHIISHQITSHHIISYHIMYHVCHVLQARPQRRECSC